MTQQVPANMTVEQVTAAQIAASQPTVSTVVNTTSGTALDLSTSVPATAKRIIVALNQVSLSGTSNVLIQVGSGSYSTSGYVGGASISGTTPTMATQTAGLQCGILALASLSATGHAILTNVTGNTWVMSFFGSRQTDGYGLLGSSVITLAGALDRVRVASANGTDTFDAGSASLHYD